MPKTWPELVGQIDFLVGAVLWAAVLVAVAGAGAALVYLYGATH